MFGASASKTPFGSTGFSTTSSAFGSQTPFGQTSQGGLFGNKSQGTTFGTPTFGSQTSGFAPGTSTAGSLFGTTASAGGLFGQQQQQQQPAGFAFGQTGNAGGIFGAASQTPATGLFQTPQQTSSIFGQQKTGFGGFGTSSASGGLFGNTATNTPFGQTSTSTSGLFGGIGAFGGGTTTGTTIKFVPVQSTEQMQKNGTTIQAQTKHQCITVMKEYEQKSLEELRLEDYNANRKSGSTGLSTAATGSTGLFGATSTTGSLFGSSGSTFGQPASSGFKGFGQTTGGIFGQQQQQQSSGLFGAKPVGTGSIFGTPSTSTTGFGTSGGLFGQTGTTGTTGLFGTQNPASSSGLFGGTSAFGQTQTTAAGGLFGGLTLGQQAQPQTGGLFGTKPLSFGASTANTGTFGTSTFSFGGTSAAPTGLFGNPTTTKSLFSFNTGGQSTFGGTNTLGATGGLFGQPAAGATGNLFGGQKTGFGAVGTGLGTGFGTSTLGAGQGLGTGLGATTGLGGTFGGLGTQNTGLNLGTSTLAGISQNTLALLQQQQVQQRLKALANSPFGDNPLFRNLPGAKTDKSALISSTLPNKSPSTASHYKAFSKPTLRVKPKPIASPSLGKAKLFEGLDDDVEVSPSTLVPRKNIKKLVIKNKSDKEIVTDEPEGLRLQLRSLIEDDSDDLIAPTPEVAVSPPRSKNDESQDDSLANLSERGGDNDVINSTVDLLNGPKKIVNSTNDDSHTVESGDEDNACQVILTRPEYYTKPSMAELNKLCSNEDCVVNNFVVGREGYGEVKFLGDTDVYGLNLDTIVFFRRREVEIYPDGYVDKPDVGFELNKKAEISLHKLWPNDKNTHTPIKSPQRLTKSGFLDRLEEKTSEMGAVFIDYRPETGTWVFQVEHFTRYGLNEQLFAEDDEAVKKKLEKASENLSFLSKDVEKKSSKLHLLGKEDITVHRDSIPETEKLDDITEPSIDDQEGTDLSSQMEEDDDLVTSGKPIISDTAGFTPFSFKQAQVLGVSSRRVQGMKAHLFDMDDENQSLYMSPKEKKLLSASLLLNESEREKSLLSRFDSPEIFSDEKIKEKLNLSSFLEPPVASRSPQKLPKLSHLLRSPFVTQPQDPQESGVSAETPVSPRRKEKSKIVSAVRKPGLCPLEKSLVNGKHEYLADIGTAKSRCFRIGWTSSQRFIHTGGPVSNTEPLTASETMNTAGTRPSIFGQTKSDVSTELPSDFTLRLGRIGTRLGTQGVDHMTKEYLQNALHHSDILPSSDGVPLINSLPGNDALKAYNDIVENYKKSVVTGPDVDTLKNLSDIWGLANALWGTLDSANTDLGGRTKHSIAYEERIQRKEAVSKWLSAVFEEEIKREVEDSKFKDNGHLDAIFSLLSGRRIGAACKTATKCRELRLALLLSQATGDDSLRGLLRKQLAEWGELKADKFFDNRRLRIYLLLSGMMVFRSAKGIVNLCDSVDWKRAFALHLWYFCSSNASISDALREYSNAFKGTDDFESYAASPKPPYARGSRRQVNAKDLSYHLLKLYCKRSHRLEKLLATDTYSDEAVDHQLSWHLHQCLISLGYSQFSDTTHDFIQANYAAQLESQGLWEWAVFVLLHIKDDTRREAAVTDVLTRFCRLEGDTDVGTLNEKEHFLVDSLEIPSRLIHSAKALHAKHESRYHDEAIHLLKAGRWNEAHIVIVNQLAAPAVIDEEYTYLKELLYQLSYPERHCTVKNWASGGQIYLDYVLMREKLTSLEKEELSVTSYMLEDLESDIASLITRIGNMSCRSSKERLCQSEMAKSCSNLLKIVLAELKSIDGVTDDDVCTWSTSKVAVQVAKLPFTPDCNLKELRELISHFSVDLET